MPCRDFFIRRSLFPLAALVIFLFMATLTWPTPSLALTATSGQYRAEVNRRRIQHRIPTLIQSYTLSAVALRRVQDMATYNFFGHISLPGNTFSTYLKTAKVRFSTSGEVIGMNLGSPRAAIAAWLQSPSHRAIVLNQRYTHIGAAVGRGIINGEPATFVVILFGRLK